MAETSSVTPLKLPARMAASVKSRKKRSTRCIQELLGGVGDAAVILFVAACKAPPVAAGMQAFVGASTLLIKHFGLFAEYKFTHSVGIASGRADIRENTHHLVGGITIPLSSF